MASAYYFLTPIFGLGLAAILLGEPFGPRDIIGLAAVAVGIALIGRPTASAHVSIGITSLSSEE